MLDAGGESALTIRALTDRLSTGSGAIYYQVGTRDDLLDTATESVTGAALAARAAGAAASASRTAPASANRCAKGRELCSTSAPTVRCRS
ncbi:hypothetical protein [Streptomyces collinus]|uniref:hypothetical protein n=1 Tax=Streptomyces collinus TaxID=42684 RepID=UPI00362F2547